MSLKLAAKVSELRVTLKPESLGEVSINVRMEGGSMAAQIDVSQTHVRAAMEANLSQLRETLADRGIQVDRIDIMTSSDSTSQESSNPSRDRGGSSSERRSGPEEFDGYESPRYLGYNTIEYLI